MQLIKKYANRKLYHTNQKQYITLEGIARLVQDGEPVQVLDNESGEEITPTAARRWTSPMPMASFPKASEPKLGDGHLRVLTVLGFPGVTTPGVTTPCSTGGVSAPPPPGREAAAAAASSTSSLIISRAP